MGTQSPPPQVVVNKLSEQGTTEETPQSVSFTLITTGSLTVNSLTVKIAKSTRGGGVEVTSGGCQILHNVPLSGTNSFTKLPIKLKAGTYIYWVSYRLKSNSLWTDLPFLPSQTFVINK